MSFKKKLIAFTIVIAFMPISLLALEVDIDEVGKTQKVEFTNFKGKPKRSNTLVQIKNIGYGLSRGIMGKKYNSSYRLNRKYSIIRIKSDTEPQKFNADVLIFGKNARIDHIKNVRRILAAYLERTYKYTPREANAIALYTTYYNAVHRGNIKYFRANYKKAVMRRLKKKSIGLSTKYYNWPGKTAILIPMTRESKRERINSFLISDRKTRNEIAKIPENKKVQKTLQKIQKREIKERQEVIKNKKQKLAKQQQILKEKKRNLKRQKSRVAKIKNPRKRKIEEQRIAREERKIQREERRQRQNARQLTRDENQTARDEKTLNQRQNQGTEQERPLRETRQEINPGTPSESKLSQERENLEQKERDLNAREDSLKNKEVDKNIFAEKLYYLKIKGYLEGGHYNNELFMINPKTMKMELKSPVTSICGKKYDVNSKGVVVIGHRGNHKAGHRLLLLDRKTLKIKKSGETNIFWRSFVRILDGYIYVIMRKDGYQYLGKFDFDLNLVAISEKRVYEDTFITFFQNYIYINQYDKKVMVLNKKDLKFIGVVKE